MFEEHGTGNEATAGLLYGISGTGKSTVLRRFTKKFGGPFQTASGIERPVVRVVTPPNSQLGDFHDAILTALGAGDLSMGKARGQETRRHRPARHAKGEAPDPRRIHPRRRGQDRKVHEEIDTLDQGDRQ
ncbi:AAA family ATPase [Methylosinus sporium]|uniref:AAA family ATPase n=1 Tax=Methylosinus sporium TaxID=428 RepID=A0A549SCP7_METSR|nr:MULTISPECIES: AAA family ATPase [Methylosinus]MBU3887658.1 TniB family NTP-binding protein [Methylosinus sp. KRF6]TRL22644.1 AAA family ATPase [Methylosinus sporium]